MNRLTAAADMAAASQGADVNDPQPSQEVIDANRRRGVRRTVIVVSTIALLIYIGFVTGLIGR
ncbi:MAG: hypothetical protein WDA70_02790 [Lysobacteraceae bacterium]|nr:hypothetical protein [Gammaproteobacteria bacterium]